MSERAAKVVLRSTGWLAQQPDWLKNSILECARLRIYKRGELTHYVGDEPGGLYGIVDGGFGVLVPSGGHEMLLCHVLRTGAWFGSGLLLTKGRRTLTFRAIEPSCALYVPLNDLEAIGTRHPEFYGKIGALSESLVLGDAIRVVGDLLIGSGERRLASVLARIASLGEGSASRVSVPVRLSQTEIGQMCNCSRDRVNKALQKFAKAGWVSINYKTITVNDVAALEAFATNDARKSARSAAADL
jgi:CRP-like cAMP-binding protein